MRKSKAVIFDFDGTLAVTMEDNFKAWKSAAAEYGLEIRGEDYYPFEGMSVFELPKRLFGAYGREAPPAREIVKKKEDYYFKNHTFSLYPGASDLVRELRTKGLRLGIVTSGLLKRLTQSVPREFLNQFDAIVTGEDTKKGKPSPEPYFRGMEKLDVGAWDCIVIENAPLGIESAKRAGAYCIALCTTMEKSYLQHADEIHSSFEDLKNSETIKRLLAC